MNAESETVVTTVGRARGFTSARRWAVLGGLCAVVTLLNVLLLPRRYTPQAAVETAALAALPLVVQAPGTIEPAATTTLRADLGGSIVSKKFKAGDRVRKGQTVVVLGRDQILSAMRVQEQTVNRSRAAVGRARKELRLQRALFKEEAVSSSSVEEAKTDLAEAEKGADRAGEALRALRKASLHNEIVAPFRGTISKDLLGNDRRVVAGREVAILSDLAHFLVVSRVGPEDSARLRRGQHATIAVPNGPRLDAAVSEIGAAEASNGSSMAAVTLALNGREDGELSTGTQVDVQIAAGETEPVISVPTTALCQHAGHPCVWTVDALHRLQARPISVGRANAERVEIAGLRPGERVVIRPEPRFSEGMKVFVDHNAAPGVH